MKILALLGLVTLLYAPVASAREDAEKAYELCERYSHRSYYTKALESCNRVRNYYRDQPEALKAELVIAEIYFKKADYEQARMSYEDFRRLHPLYPVYVVGEDGEPGRGMDFVVYREGLSMFKRASKIPGRDQTATRSSLATWSWCPPGRQEGGARGYDQCFPESAYLAEVQALQAKGLDRLAEKELVVARFYAERGVWRAVIDRAQGMVRLYPESAHVPEALALLAEAQHASGDLQGAAAALAALESGHPGSAWIPRVRRALEREPGQPAEDEIFVRPHRISTTGMPGMGM
ncbi:MAG: outer membrane protein assembly factor BamD [Deltaproteobacteria bacterium]|nr:outer membrane protein assembly factor BamD [Deltaproteobacteria bacterium]